MSQCISVWVSRELDPKRDTLTHRGSCSHSHGFLLEVFEGQARYILKALQSELEITRESGEHAFLNALKYSGLVHSMTRVFF